VEAQIASSVFVVAVMIAVPSVPAAIDLIAPVVPCTVTVVGVVPVTRGAMPVAAAGRYPAIRDVHLAIALALPVPANPDMTIAVPLPIARCPHIAMACCGNGLVNRSRGSDLYFHDRTVSGCGGKHTRGGRDGGP